MSRIDELDFGAVQKQHSGNAVNRCIAPALVEELADGQPRDPPKRMTHPTGLVQVVKVIHVLLDTPEAQITDLKVAPEVA